MLAARAHCDALNAVTAVLQSEGDLAIGGDGDGAFERIATDVGHFHMDALHALCQAHGAATIVVGHAHHFTVYAHGCANEGFIGTLARDGEMHHLARSVGLLCRKHGRSCCKGCSNGRCIRRWEGVVRSRQICSIRHRSD